MSFVKLQIAVLATLVGTTQARAQTALQWKWSKGEKLAYVLQDVYTSKTTIDQDFFELTQSLTLDTTWHVKSVDLAGEANVVVTIERVRFTTDGKGGAAVGKMNFDSQDVKEPQSKPEKSVFTALKSLLGPEITLTVNPQGRVLTFDLPKAVASAMEDQTTRELAGFFGDLFTAEGVRHRLTNWLVTLPNEPVSEKESWRGDKLSRLGKSVACVHTCTFAARVKREGLEVIKIDVKPELRLLAGEADKELGKITEQEGKGIVYFDNGLGRLTESTVTHRAVIQSFAKITFDAKSSAKLAVESNK